MHVLDLDVAQALVCALQQNVDAAVFAVRTSRLKAGITSKMFDATAAMASATRLVGVLGVDAHQRRPWPRSASTISQVKRYFAGRTVAFGEPYGGARRGQTQHRAGVRARRRHRVAGIVEPDVGKVPRVPWTTGAEMERECMAGRQPTAKAAAG